MRLPRLLPPAYCILSCQRRLTCVPYGCALDYSDASSSRPLGSSLFGSVLALVVFCYRTVNSKVRVIGTVTSREVRATEGCFVALCVGEYTFPNMHAGATSNDLEIAGIIVLQSQHAPARFNSCGIIIQEFGVDPKLNLTTFVSRSAAPLSELHDRSCSLTFHGKFEKWPFVPSLFRKTCRCGSK